eukprot:SAG22_NODE_9530_length_584_cov_185.123711_1_plen_139_part_00
MRELNVPLRSATISHHAPTRCARAVAAETCGSRVRAWVPVVIVDLAGQDLALEPPSPVTVPAAPVAAAGRRRRRLPGTRAVIGDVRTLRRRDAPSRVWLGGYHHRRGRHRQGLVELPGQDAQNSSMTFDRSDTPPYKS